MLIRLNIMIILLYVYQTIIIAYLKYIQILLKNKKDGMLN